MLSYCLKYRNNTENINRKMVKTKKEEQCFHHNVQCVIVKKSRYMKVEEAK